MGQAIEIFVEVAILILLLLHILELRKIRKRQEEHEFYLHTHPYKVKHPRGHPDHNPDPYAGRGTNVPPGA